METKEILAKFEDLCAECGYVDLDEPAKIFLESIGAHISLIPFSCGMECCGIESICLVLETDEEIDLTARR